MDCSCNLNCEIVPEKDIHSELDNVEIVLQEYMDCSCNLNCEIVPEKDIYAELDNVETVSREYTGINTPDININVDNSDHTISAVKNTYVHEQLLASSVWNINHNLNRYPSVTIIDSGGNIIYCDIQYLDKNNIRITFNSEFGGYAYLN